MIELTSNCPPSGTSWEEKTTAPRCPLHSHNGTRRSPRSSYFDFPDFHQNPCHRHIHHHYLHCGTDSCPHLGTASWEGVLTLCIEAVLFLLFFIKFLIIRWRWRPATVKEGSRTGPTQRRAKSFTRWIFPKLRYCWLHCRTQNTVHTIQTKTLYMARQKLLKRFMLKMDGWMIFKTWHCYDDPWKVKHSL